MEKAKDLVTQANDLAFRYVKCFKSYVEFLEQCGISENLSVEEKKQAQERLPREFREAAEKLYVQAYSAKQALDRFYATNPSLFKKPAAETQSAQSPR